MNNTDISEISLPCEVRQIIETLERNGFEAYAVGGCVRDHLMGVEPVDWDICTSALPEQTMMVFSGKHIIETGLKHGTITLRLNHKPFEITTFRVDGKYKDNRRPDSVRFVSVLKRDLARRDFTINSLAYAPRTGIKDYYGGQEDIACKRIKCVGNPDKRFGEDALRILRALRFAANLGFEIEERTAQSIHNNRSLLKNIASERIAAELGKLLCGHGAAAVLREFRDVFTVFIPELDAMAGFEQNSKYHHLDVWEHTLAAVTAAPLDSTLRLTVLLHDIAKPPCYTEENGTGHFFGHGKLGAEMAKTILRRLKYDNDTVDAVSTLVLHHDAVIEPRAKIVRRWLSRIGEERLRQLLAVQRADAAGHAEEPRDTKVAALDEVLPVLSEIIAEQQCFSLKDLAVNGRDLIEIGITDGQTIGKTLTALLDMVIDEIIENDKQVLLNKAREFQTS